MKGEHVRGRGRSLGRTSGLITAFLACCVLLVGFAVVGYWAGWITFHQDELRQKTTIEVNTQDVEKAAEGAAEGGQELLEEAGERLENLKEHETLTPVESPSARDAAGSP